MAKGDVGDPWLVKQSAGDYSSLSTALSNASTLTGDYIEIQGGWTIDDTVTCTVADTNLNISVTGTARHSGYIEGTGTTSSIHHRLRTSAGHCMTVSSGGGTIDGLVYIQAGTGSSDECARTSASTDFKNCIMMSESDTGSQDGIYSGAGSITIGVEQCLLYGFYRVGLHNQLQTSNTWNINSCTVWDCGLASVGTFTSTANAGGGIVVTRTSTGVVMNIHNSISVENDQGTSAVDYGTYSGGPAVFNIEYSMDSDNSIATADAGGVGNIASRVIAESTAGGNELLVNDITTTPYDLRLVDDATNNDAQDAHTTATANSQTIPSTDVAGTTRPTNTSYDMGFFEVSGVAAIIMTISETIAASDAYTSRLAALFTVAETTAITDADSGKLSTSMTVSESASSSDSEGAQAAMNATISEALVAADLLSGVIVPGGTTVTMTVGEAVAAADNLSFKASFTMSISETASAVDSVSSRAAFAASIAEAVSAIDTVVAFSPTAYSLTMSESVNIADLFNLAGDAGIITATITITQILSANILDEQLINGEVTDKPLIDGDITEIPVISGTITVS